MQDRGKDATHLSCFLECPEKLMQKYIVHMAVTINLDVDKISIKSLEYQKLEIENKQLKERETKLNNILCRLKLPGQSD